MSPNIQPTAKQVGLANKSPQAYVIVVLVILLGAFVGLYAHSNSYNRNDCKEEVAALRAETKDLRAQLNIAYGIISQTNKDFNTLKHNTDSVIRRVIKHQLKK